MKRFLLSILVLSCFAWSVSAQDIPLFSQKLTNSFIYNPAIAGHTYGSMTYSFKQNYAKISGSPQNHFLSIHAPIAGHRFGIGANVYQEDVTFLRSTYASGAFAYHLHLNKLSVLSMGVSAEYNALGLNGDPNFSTSSIGSTDGSGSDSDFDKFKSNGIKDYDFSFGLHYQNRFLKAGIAANRLSTTWLKAENTAVLSNYYSAFVQGLIPLRNKEDLLEPYFAYRKLSGTNSILDLGLFYTFNDKITAGASMRSGKVLSTTIAFHFSKYLTIGYSREMITGNVGGFVGAANEFTIRYDFNNESYKERFRADYKSSVAYRRKTMSSPIAKMSGKSPKQVHRKQKKLSAYSPNSRYQNIKKLSVKKKSSGKKKSFGKKKKKKSQKRRR